MSFRIRLGPFTFGKSGARLSVWNRLGGISKPLTGAGRMFGRIKVGRFSWWKTWKK